MHRGWENDPIEILDVPGSRFGVVGDTHDELVDWPPVVARLADLWGEVDGILHCGDLTSMAALDTLAAIAPVFASRSTGDPPEAPPRLLDGPRLFRLSGLAVGLVFSFGDRPLHRAAATETFGVEIDVCLHGGTHRPEVTSEDGILFVNPGSPTLSPDPSVALLTVDAGAAAAEVLRIV